MSSIKRMMKKMMTDQKLDPSPIREICGSVCRTGVSRRHYHAAIEIF